MLAIWLDVHGFVRVRRYARDIHHHVQLGCDPFVPEHLSIIGAKSGIALRPNEDEARPFFFVRIQGHRVDGLLPLLVSPHDGGDERSTFSKGQLSGGDVGGDTLAFVRVSRGVFAFAFRKDTAADLGGGTADDYPSGEADSETN